MSDNVIGINNRVFTANHLDNDDEHFPDWHADAEAQTMEELKINIADAGLLQRYGQIHINKWDGKSWEYDVEIMRHE